MSEQTPSQIAERVRDIIADKSNHLLSDVTHEKDLRNDLGFDSLDSVELAIELEKEWNLAFTDEEMEKIVTVGDAIEAVEKKLQK